MKIQFNRVIGLRGGSNLRWTGQFVGKFGLARYGWSLTMTFNISELNQRLIDGRWARIQFLQLSITRNI